MPFTALCSPVGASVVPVACLVGLVGGPVRAAPAEPTANRRLRRCGCARQPCGRQPCVLCMQTWATPRAHVVNRASHRRHAPLRRRPCLLVPKRVLQAPKDEGGARPADGLADPRLRCASRWVSRGRAARARPHRGSGTAPRGQDLVALAGGARRGRTRPTRTRRLHHPRMPVPHRFLCSPRFVCTLGGHRRSHNPAGAPDRSHDAFCRARCPPRAPPRQVHPHARVHTRAHTPHGPPGRPPPPPVTNPPSRRRRAACLRLQRALGAHGPHAPAGCVSWVAEGGACPGRSCHSK